MLHSNKNNKVVIYITTWIKIGNIIVGGLSHKRPHTVWLYLYETSRINKSIGTES